MQTVNSDSITSINAYFLLTFISFCGLEQHNTIINKVGYVLDLVLSNMPILSINQVPIPLVQIDGSHLPFIAEVSLPYKPPASCKSPNECFSRGDYLRL